MDSITGNIPKNVRVSGIISQKVLQGLSAYQIAVENGFQGTQAEWLQSLRGEHIEFKSEGLSIYYKYESDVDWTLLVQIDQLMADYSVLDHKPSINNITLEGNKTLDELGIQAKGDFVEKQTGYGLISNAEKERLSHVDNYDDTTIRQAIEAIVLAAVTGVKGAAETDYRTGYVNITPANIGLNNVDNTHDIDKNVHSAVQDSDGNVIHSTYFSGISESQGQVSLVRPDGTAQKLMNSVHSHDASEITSGTIDVARLPAGALERMVDVADRTARYALTTATVQNGDTVRQLDTGVMYRVVDDTKLNKSAGYKEYTAGRASAVPWSGIEDKPDTFIPSAHTHNVSQITNIASASVAEATKLKNPRSISITGGASATGVQFDGTSNIALSINSLNAAYLSGTGAIDITGNAATATQFSHQRTIEVTGKATAAPKVYDGRQNIALQVTSLDAAPTVHTHTMSQITDLDIPDAEGIANFVTSNTDNFTDVWFSDPLTTNKPVHNSGIQYNPYRNILKAGTFQGNLIGVASSASALTSDAGTATHPVYFVNGIPVATTYELNATVPADAVFTDTNTHYVSDIVVAGNFNSKVNTQVALTNGNVYLNHIENNQVTSSHKISGTGTTTVTADEFGNIIVNATGNDYAQGSGITISNYTISNSGVRAVSESTENGYITVNTNGTTSNVPVHGLGTAAFTDSTSYATSNHNHPFSAITNKPTTLSGYGITDAASSSHGHDASDITSGTIDIARLPSGAMGNFISVPNEAARYALSSANVHNGDTVQQDDTGVMYRVIDDTNLNNASGYKEYTAGAASSVPWTGVTGKPESFTPSAHTHSVAEITDITSATVAKAAQLSTARTISLTGAVTGSGEFDGSQNLTITTTANHTHQYAGSQTIGGPANSAVMLTTSAGTSTTPVFFYEGKPVAVNYQLNASVPSDAVFTDTHYQSSTVVNSADDSTSDASRTITNGNVFINHVENGVVRSSHGIIGSGSVTVTYNGQGDIVINGQGQDYTALPNPYSLSINGTTYDGSSAIDVGVIDVAHGGTGNSAVDTSPTVESARMVTSGGVYTALLGKADLNHTHNYAGSSAAGGSATTAEALTSNAGSTTQPVYFSSGKPTATTYSLNATVPADAVFTDTHHQSSTVIADSSSATSNTSSTVANGSVHINHVENNSVRSSHRITGTGSATVTTDTSGNIIINADDTKYTALPNPYNISINGQTYDGSSQVTIGVLGVAYGGTGNSSVDTTPTEDSTKMITSGGVYDALDGKADTNHTHSYAGSTSAGGSATSAVKLDSNAGSATQPIYFTGGKPTACTYALNKTVPADALFTDSHYESKTVVASSNSATTDTSESLANTHVFINHVENGAVTASHRISGSGATSVTTDSSGNIIISSSEISIHDASEIKTGVFDIARIPVAALERLVTVNDLTAMYALTTNDVQVGDTVQCEDTGIMYRVIDTSNLDNADGYREYTAGAAASVPWSGITGKPETFTPSSHTHMYAGSSTVGGSATSAVKLDSNAGSATNPVYFSGGKPTACTYELNTTVPANAEFTDTHYEAKLVVTNSASGTSDATTAIIDNNVFLNLVENNTVRSHHRIMGQGATSITTDSSGNLLISSIDTKPTAGTGIDVSSQFAISNTGVLSITTGQTNGTISVNTGGTSAEVSVYGLGSAAFTNSSAYATAEHTHSYAGSSTPGGDATNAAQATKLASSKSLVVGLSNVYDASTNTSLFDGSSDLDGQTVSGVTNKTIPIRGTLGVGHGGTGQQSFTAYSLLIGNGSGSISTISPGTNGFVLKATGTNNAPEWTSQSDLIVGSANRLSSAVSLAVALDSVYSSIAPVVFDGSQSLDDSDATHKAIPIKGTLGVAHGGTGQTSFTSNAVLYADSSGVIGNTGAGSAGQLLKANGANAAPSWEDVSNIAVASADKLTTARTITLAEASGANGGVTGSITTNLNTDITINTTLTSHTHAASDITSGILSVSRGGTGYDTIDAKPISGSDHVVKSSGVHKRIAYKKVQVSSIAWSGQNINQMTGEVFLRQLIQTENDINANTEIVSVKPIGSDLGKIKSAQVSWIYTGDGTTTTFYLKDIPNEILVLTVGGSPVSDSSYTITDNMLTFTTAPESDAEIYIRYYTEYLSDIQYSYITSVITGPSTLEFRAYRKPHSSLTFIVGYVSETLSLLNEIIQPPLPELDYPQTEGTTPSGQYDYSIDLIDGHIIRTDLTNIEQ